MKRLIYILPAVGFIVLAVVLYRSLFMAPTILPSALINKPAPHLTLPALDAQTQGFGPKELAGGHVSVVNVFASWCIPCHVEAPVLMQLAAMRDKDKFEIYGFVQRDTPDKIVYDDLKANATLTAMLAYLASEDPTMITRERVDLAAAAARLAAQAPPPNAAGNRRGGFRFRVPTTWPPCTKAPRTTKPRLK